MLSTCYNCHKEVTTATPCNYFFALAELVLLVTGVFFTLKIGGMPQPVGIAMLSLGGAALIFDLMILRGLSNHATLRPKQTPQDLEILPIRNQILANGIELHIYDYSELSFDLLPTKVSHFFFYFPKDQAKSIANIALFCRNNNDFLSLDHILSRSTCFNCFDAHVTIGKLSIAALFNNKHTYYSLKGKCGETIEDLRKKKR